MLFDLPVSRMSPKDRIDILEKKYDLKLRDMERSFDTMCNLSQGLIEQGIEQGIKQGIAQGYDKASDDFIVKLLRKGKTPGEVAELLDVPLKNVEEIQNRIA